MAIGELGQGILDVQNAAIAAGATSASVAATGADQAGAALLTKAVIMVTGADNAKGVRLPPATVGLIYCVLNAEAINRAIVYPATGETIASTATGALGANVGVNVGGAGLGIFICGTAGVWNAILGFTWYGNGSDWDIGLGRLGGKRLQLHVPDTATATTDGLTTGLIPQYASRVTVTSDLATKKISLPAADVGDLVRLDIGATGCKLISTVAAHKANNVTIGATNQLALLANATYVCQYIGTNDWRITGHTQAGAPIGVSTSALATITIADAEGTPDYALQAVTVTAPYGLATQQEAITLMYVIKNLQVRMAELETALALTPVAI